MKIVKLLFLTTSTWATSAFVIERKLLVYNEYWNKSLDVGIKLVGLDLAVRISIHLEKWSLSMKVVSSIITSLNQSGSSTVWLFAFRNAYTSMKSSSESLFVSAPEIS